MKHSNLLIKSLLVLFISLVLGFLSVLAGKMLTDYDLGQIIYILIFFFPITVLATGILANTMLKKFWLAPLISLISIATVMLVMFKAANVAYLLGYMGVSLVGYLLAFAVGKLFKKQKTM